MESKASATRKITLIGIKDGAISKLPVICVRKNVIRGTQDKDSVRKSYEDSEVLGFVSHPGLYKSATAPYVDAWCHCFKNPDKYLPKEKPRLLLSESDFVDQKYIQVCSPRKANWDAFYFTMGGKKSARRKGFTLFLRMLPHLINRDMKVIVINYTGKKLWFDNSTYRNIWEKCKDRNIYYIQQKLSPRRTARVMAKSNFGIFPNGSDCSPLLLTESLVRNKPVLVHDKILGGWKYINNNTGVFFNENNISERLDKMSKIKFSPREDFSANYGFEKSAKMFAEFGVQHFEGFQGYNMVCFEGLESALKKFL